MTIWRSIHKLLPQLLLLLTRQPIAPATATPAPFGKWHDYLENFNGVVCFLMTVMFGILQRVMYMLCNLKVRRLTGRIYLISRGRLETSDSGIPAHLQLLHSLPVGERARDWRPRPRALHERNQRRAALLPHISNSTAATLTSASLSLSALQTAVCTYET